MTKTVMIVEDYSDSREMLRFLIQQKGYQVIEAVDGVDAVEKSAFYHPDLILMDLVLPLMDGVAATQIIREAEGVEKVSIVALTGYGHTSIDKVVELGFDGLLTKPLQFEKLEPLLKYYLT